METKANVPTFACDANTRPLTPPLEANPAARSRDRGRAKPTTADLPKDKEQSFSELSQREQLYRIRPHLQRIIEDRYPPAMPRLDLFYAGRYDAVRKLAKYGDIRENEAINVFGAEIRRWALRAERWGSEGKPSVGVTRKAFPCMADRRAWKMNQRVLPARPATRSCHRNNGNSSSSMPSFPKRSLRSASYRMSCLRNTRTSRQSTKLR